MVQKKNGLSDWIKLPFLASLRIRNLWIFQHSFLHHAFLKIFNNLPISYNIFKFFILLENKMFHINQCYIISIYSKIIKKKSWDGKYFLYKKIFHTAWVKIYSIYKKKKRKLFQLFFPGCNISAYVATLLRSNFDI